MHYNVAPRYTAGSPAMVPERIALQVAAEEKEDYERALEGVYGERIQQQARTEGLAGIVERRWEKGDGWQVEDVLTGRRFHRRRCRPNKLKPGDTVVAAHDTCHPTLKFNVPFTATRIVKPSKSGLLSSTYIVEVRERTLPEVIERYVDLTIENDLPEGK